MEYGILESATPPATCPTWACFSSGKNPGKLVYMYLSALKKQSTGVTFPF